jgi:hypothetical protein
MSPIEIAWTSVGIVVPMLVGAAFACVGYSPPDFRRARVCFYLSGIILGGMEIVWYAQTGWSFAGRVMVATLMCLIIGIGLPETLRWVHRRELSARALPQQDVEQKDAPKVEQPKPAIKTLHDLFLSDCPHTQMFSTYILTATNGTYEIEYSVCGDFQSKSLYLTFFLPKSDSTLPACRYLPTAYRDILGGKIKLLMRGMIHQAPGERPENWEELKASGRIFVYSETNLLQSDIESLTKEYEKEGLSPQFRSRDYEILRNSPLYDGQHY